MSQISEAMTRASVLLSLLFGMLLGQPAAFAAAPAAPRASANLDIAIGLAPDEGQGRLVAQRGDGDEDKDGDGADPAVLAAGIDLAQPIFRQARVSIPSDSAPVERRPSANRARAPPSA